MTLFQFENISIFKLESGEVLGFHNDNLEVAQLSPSVWDAVKARLAESAADPRSAAGSNDTSEEMAELKFWSDSVNTRVKRAVVQQKIKTLTINTTQLCNLKCTYCAAGGDGTYGSPTVKLDLKRGLPQLEWLMLRCLPGERFQINFLGGEPLLYPDVMRAIAQKAAQLAEENQVALRFGVVTNGTLLSNPKVMDLLQEFRVAVTVSVDGPPEVQDHFRPKKSGGNAANKVSADSVKTGDNFIKVNNSPIQTEQDSPKTENSSQTAREGSSVELEKGLVALGQIKNRLPSIGLAAVFHRDYVNVLETYKYFLQWNFDYYEFNYSHTDFDPVASKAFARQLDAVAHLADSMGGEEELRKIRSFDSILNRLDEQVQLENFCGSGKSLLSMDAKGDLYACPWDINDKSLKLQVPSARSNAWAKSTVFSNLSASSMSPNSSSSLATFDPPGASTLGLKAEAYSNYLESYQVPQIDKPGCHDCWAKFVCGGGCNYIHKMGAVNKPAEKVNSIFCERTQSLIMTTIMYYEKYRRVSNETH